MPLCRAWPPLCGPEGYAERSAVVERQTYIQQAAFDVILAGIAATFAQGLGVIPNANPHEPP